MYGKVSSASYKINSKINQNLKGMQEVIKTLMSIPGVGFITTAAILAEIENIDVFSKPKKLVELSRIYGALFYWETLVRPFSSSFLSLFVISMRGCLA
jgi:hypothetical protein